MKRMPQTRPPCPHCHKGRVHLNGKNRLATGYIQQRYYCQDCDRGFTVKRDRRNKA